MGLMVLLSENCVYDYMHAYPMSLLLTQASNTEFSKADI